MNDSISEKQYQIRRLGDDNIADLGRLHAAVYGKKPTKNYFRNKFDTAYTGVSNIGYFAYNDEGIPIAFYGVTPCFLTNGADLILAAQSVDTMTHPEYRFKGMFVELSERCFQLCKDNGILLIFGFPNQNSYRGAIKLGWQMTEQLDLFKMSVQSFPWERLANRFWLTNKLYGFMVGLMLNSYLSSEKGVQNEVFKEGFIGINRDENYLNYKTYSKTLVLKIGTSRVWVKIKNGLIIGDVLLNGERFDFVMANLQKICRTIGVREITFQCSKELMMHHLFSTLNEPTPSFPCLFQNFGVDIPIHKIKYTFADIDVF